MSLRAVTLAVPYLDDSSVHEQMVRFATAQLAGGHLPLTSWFPYLGLGLAAVPALPEPSGDADRDGRAGRRVPTSRFAGRCTCCCRCGRSACTWPRGCSGRAAGRRGVGRDVAVPGQRHRDRLRAARLRLDRLRGVDPAVGVDDAAAGVGLRLAGDPSRAATVFAAVAFVCADDRAALRDRVSRADPARALAVGGRRATRGPRPPGGGARGRRRWSRRRG